MLGEVVLLPAQAGGPLLPAAPPPGGPPPMQGVCEHA